MAVNISINGFGRIGRLVCRLASLINDIYIIAVNDIVPPHNFACLLNMTLLMETLEEILNQMKNP